jgi:signal peptidase I
MTQAAIAVVVAGAATFVVLVAGLTRTRLLVVTIDGDSMAPTYARGERLLVWRTRLRHVRRGAAVLVRLPPPERSGAGTAQELMIKRAAAIPGDPVPAGVPVPDSHVPPEHLVVVGDNPHGSYDSRIVGYVPAQALLGVVIRRMTPPGGRP